MSIPSGFHPTLCHDHAEIKPCPKCTIEDAEFARIFTTDQTSKVEKKVWEVPHPEHFTGTAIMVNSEYVDQLEAELKDYESGNYYLDERFEQLEQDKKDLIDALKKIEKNFCACYIDDDIIPQVVARETLTKMGVSL
jgi:hypothetical protein